MTPCETRVSHELEAIAYRVAHEALTNVAKHAGASRVDVTITVDEVLRCEIRDDGLGFDDSLVDSALSRGSLGLHIARERIERSGGTLLVRSAAGEGTTLGFELALGQGRRAPEEIDLVTA